MDEQDKPAQELTDKPPAETRRLLPATDARHLMVRSVRGLDAKLSEISQIIQATARKGETRAEVYSIQTSRSSLPAFERIDNMGRVLLETLRQSGYDARLKEFRTSDSCMLYILADWSKMVEESAAARSKPPESKNEAGALPQAKSKPTRRPNAATAAEATSDQAEASDQANTDATSSAAGNREASAKSAKPAADKGKSSAAAEAPGSDHDPDSEEVKTKKFDPDKMIHTPSEGSGDSKFTEFNRNIGPSSTRDEERVPVIYPVVMPSRS